MSESKMNISAGNANDAQDAQKNTNKSLLKEVDHLFRVSSMKKAVHNNESNEDKKAGEQEMSWETAIAYATGHKVNEENQKLIDLRKSKAEETKSWYDNETSPIKVSSVPPMINQSTRSSSLNWNKLRILLDDENTILTAKGIEMLKANHNLNEKQIREWHAGILRDCPNGKLSKNQFVAGYEQLYPGGKAKDFCKNTFATFDRDNTGTIEFHEFMLAIGLTQSNDLDLRFALAFDMHNYHYNETMDANQLAEAISILYDLIGETDRKDDRDPKHRAEEIVRMYDVTDKKKLTRNEFVVGCKNDHVIRRLLVPDA